MYLNMLVSLLELRGGICEEGEGRGGEEREEGVNLRGGEVRGICEEGEGEGREEGVNLRVGMYLVFLEIAYSCWCLFITSWR